MNFKRIQRFENLFLNSLISSRVLLVYIIFCTFQHNVLVIISLFVYSVLAVLSIVELKTTFFWRISYVFVVFSVFSDLSMRLETADNHIYLIVWVLIIFPLFENNSRFTLNETLKFTLIIVFISAAIWKLQNREFISGELLIAASLSYQNVG